MKHYDAVLFDMDGTLLDTLEDLRDSVNAVLAGVGYPLRTLDEIRAAVGYGVERLIEASVPGGREDERFDDVVRAYRAYYPAHCEIKTRPYPGVTGLTEKLKKAGIRTAVVSNKPHATTCSLSEKLFPAIDVACGEQESNGIRRKPAADMIDWTVARLGVPKEKCVYIGDSEVDVLTAKNAGMDVISVLWGFRDRAVLEKAGATRFAETADELGALLMGAEHGR